MNHLLAPPPLSQYQPNQPGYNYSIASVFLSSASCTLCASFTANMIVAGRATVCMCGIN
jgi:hypothetical protein